MSQPAVVQQAQPPSIIDSIFSLEKSFKAQNAYDLKFENECLFAKQQILKNDYSVKAAQNAPDALRNAILNVAAVGISLNPASAHAYLVPRSPAKGQAPQICLDVSYRGMVKLATDSGSIKWAKSELVYEGDEFEWRGMAEIPLHSPVDPFADHTTLEGLRGGFCVAQLSDGSYMVDRMSAADILKVANTSKASNGPWKTWPTEMAKKTLVKRASKSWPQSAGRSRLDQAIELVNEHEGLEPEPVVARASDYLQPTEEQTATYLELAKGEPLPFWLWYSAQDERLKVSLPGCKFEHGTKQKMMKAFNNTLEAGRLEWEGYNIDFRALCDSQDEHGAAEFLADFTDDQRELLIEGLVPELATFARSIEVEA